LKIELSSFFEKHSTANNETLSLVKLSEGKINNQIDKLLENQMINYEAFISSNKNVETSLGNFLEDAFTKYIHSNRSESDQKRKVLQNLKSQLESLLALQTSSFGMLEALNSGNQTTKQELTNAFSENQKEIIKASSLVKEQIVQLPNELYKRLENQKNHLDFQLSQQLNTTYDRIDALLSIHNLIEINAPLPIMHDWRISSDYAKELLNHVINNDGSVIDIGSGISTLLFGYGLKGKGTGKVIAIEHSKNYYEATKKLITEHQLGKWCNVYFCPLRSYTINGKKWLWYDISDIDFPKNISTISIDGPPGDTQDLARYPAPHILKKHISKNTTLFLDDANREQEKEIAKRWVEEFRFNFVHDENHKGTIKFIPK
jgi:hypothetical protein